MQSVIETIKDRLPITEVLSTYIPLIPAGSQYKAKCPFHNERTASFSVNPERGFYYCFGCGEKGDIFTFVQKFEGIDFNGALKLLASRAGVALARNDRKEDSNEGLYDVLDRAAKSYQTMLVKNPKALEYLQARGMAEETVKEFGIGYAPSEWRYLSESYATEKEKAEAERAGLIKKTEKGYYDRFRGRIMFPLSDASGRVVGFSGRIFPEIKDDQAPKYLNSPETNVFQKSRILYGFDKAKQHIRKHNFAILVEGQMDMVLSHQAGFKNTVATSGTAVSESVVSDAGAHLTVISKMTPNIMLAFDGDIAGKKALERAALVALALQMNPKVVALPESVDPADFVKNEGADAWKKALKESEHFIMYELGAIRAENPSPHKLQSLIKEKIFPYLSRITSAVERQTYINAIAANIGVGSNEVQTDFLTYQKQQTVETTPVQVAQRERAVLTPYERFAALCMVYPEASSEAKEMIESFNFNSEKIEHETIVPEQLELATVLVTQEYGMLDDEARKTVIAEIAETIISQFLETLRFKYSLLMNEAKKRGDDALELEYLAHLQSINRHRHKT